jgi:hypothetical protein
MLTQLLGGRNKEGVPMASPPFGGLKLGEMAGSEDPVIREQFDRIKAQIERLHEAVREF